MQMSRKTFFNKLLPRAASLLLSLAVVACAAPIPGKYAYQAGWRHVEFVGAIADGIGDVPISIDCRHDFGMLNNSGTAFVLVKQRITKGRWFHTARYWIVLADDVQRLKVGDIMYANSLDCRMPIAPAESP